MPRTNAPIADCRVLHLADLADRRWSRFPDATDPIWRASGNATMPRGPEPPTTGRPPIPTDYRPAAGPHRQPQDSLAAMLPVAFIHLWVVFGLFSSVTSAGLCLQCRFSGVKVALYKPQLTGPR
jgi:hypothetical protein